MLEALERRGNFAHEHGPTLVMAERRAETMLSPSFTIAK